MATYRKFCCLIYEDPGCLPDISLVTTQCPCQLQCGRGGVIDVHVKRVDGGTVHVVPEVEGAYTAGACNGWREQTSLAASSSCTARLQINVVACTEMRDSH